MFINDKIVFLELQKTGCSHIVKLLEEFIPGKQIGKHHLLRPQDAHKKIIGSVRNPWDWYISLWAYGCNQQGGLYKRSVNRAKLNAYLKPFGTNNYTIQNLPLYVYDTMTKPKDKWKSLYEDSNNFKNFRNWLKLVLTSNRKRDFGGGFAFHPVSKFAGLLTYRYCRLFTKSFFENATRNKISTLEGLKNFDRKQNRVLGIIKNESLELDFINLLEQLGYNLQDSEKQKILGKSKTNTSEHQSRSYYYDEETIELIVSKEQFIIEKFNYKKTVIH